ncbi:DUF5681 domain-containing protein [Nitrobacter vulgaris]|uniref:DUF5681 domain-containing protein n=1 Tax=Nitrobacter vulgaris TaxID=29421 RepID=A0A1V4HZH7_NITVU|nr:DUF5681 domain-containing protein [Nitrobacter vulgaris]OPH83304.1 hypothetical protein B2M20_07660 [Nitrobacter vulgaris]
MSKTFEPDPPDAAKESGSRVSSVGEDVADEDKVGYRRPPKSSQFKKGQSGNPLGSSRKARMRQRQQTLPLGELVLENSRGLVPIREGDRRSTVSLKEALIRREAALAIQGSRLALKSCLDRIDKAEQRELAEVLAHYETYRDIQAHYPAKAKACRDRGLPPPLPHPDDVHFDYSTYKLKITGPINHEQFHRLEKILEAREIFMTKIAEQRADAEECARQGCPYSPSDFDFINRLEGYLKIFDDELEKRGWLPRIAGRKEA